MPLGIIFATSLKGVFALNGKLPWHCPPDMEFFRRITTGTNVVMGRKTMESIGSPLPKRQNYVLTRSDKPLIEGFMPITIEECLYFSLKETFWVIGGTEVIDSFIKDHEPKIVIHNIIGDSFCTPINPNDDVKTFLLWPKGRHPYNVFKLHDDVTCNIYVRRDRNKSLDEKYLQLGASILGQQGRMTRNGMVRSTFDDVSITASFEDGFPILQSKKVWWKGVLEEFNFFLSGSTDTTILSKAGVKIWEPNTSEEFLKANGKSHLQPGDMGPMYGFQLRHFGEKYQGMDYPYKGIDQIEDVINLIVRDPMSRRILMTTYNPSQASEGVLYPCHGLVTQFYVEDNKISLKTYQRSADWVLGVPFNISSYGLLLDYIVKEVNSRQDKIKYIPDKITIIFGDAHIYECHVSAFLQQYIYYLMGVVNQDKVILNGDVLENYNPLVTINAKMVA